MLNARQAACDFGFLTVPEFIALTDQSLATIARLEKYRGHLFNWYDTQTLEPLNDAPFVSSVDSGNFVASLYTLRSSAVALTRQSLVGPQLFSALCAHWHLVCSQGRVPAPLSQLSPPSVEAPKDVWIAWLFTADAALRAIPASPNTESDSAWWLTETSRRVGAILALLRDYLPWLLPQYAALGAVPDIAIQRNVFALPIDEAAAFSEQLEQRLAGALTTVVDNEALLALGEQLRSALRKATQNLKTLNSALNHIAWQAERLVKETEFAFLADPGRQILSIGYDVRASKIHDACYDLIASEARIATFIAIASDEIPQESWFKLGREHARAFGQFLLLSWTGTMFEYLMPALWMRSYPDTLISRTLAACVRVQNAWARFGVYDNEFINGTRSYNL